MAIPTEPHSPMVNPLGSDPVRTWRLRSRTVSWGKFPLLMGIVNVTPDSFSDGGQWNDPQAAVARGIDLWQHGADILDIGGESTRPYSQPVSEAEEMRRTIPVIRDLAEKTQAIISVDTSKARVALEAIAAGAEIINDVTGLTGDSQMERVAVETGAGVCVMHMQGTPQTMQDNPSYVDIVAEIKDFLIGRRRHLIRIGIAAEKIALDPGLGFGKTHLHNWELIGRIHEFHDLGCPLLIGHSRKGFIAKLSGDGMPARDVGTLVVSLRLAEQGVGVLRLHEVSTTRLAFRILEAIGGG